MDGTPSSVLTLGLNQGPELLLTFGFGIYSAVMTLTQADIDAIANAVCTKCMSDPRFLTVAKYLALK